MGIIIPCVDCVCLVTLADWSSVWSGALGHSVVWPPWWNGQQGIGHGPGDPGAFHSEGTLAAQLKMKGVQGWGSQVYPYRGHPGRAAKAEVDMSWS